MPDHDTLTRAEVMAARGYDEPTTRRDSSHDAPWPKPDDPAPKSTDEPGRRCSECGDHIDGLHHLRKICLKDGCAKARAARYTRKSRGTARAKTKTARRWMEPPSPPAAPPPADGRVEDLADLERLGTAFVEACAVERAARVRRVEIQTELSAEIAEVAS